MDKTHKNDDIFQNISNSSGGRIDTATIKQAAKSGSAEPLLKSLSEDQKKQLDSILSDKKALEGLLKSPQAAALLKSLQGGGKNG